MDRFSFQEDEEPRQLHCLQQEIGEHQIDTWMGNSQERADDDLEFDGCILSHFDLNIPSLEEIPVNNSKQNKVCQQPCQFLADQTDEISKENQPGIEQQPKISIQEQSSQTGQTFYEQQNISTTIVQGNPAEDNWQKQSGEVLHQFIALSESIYTPILKSFKQMLQDIKHYSDKTMENLNMYHLFFTIKLEQEKERSRILKSRCQGIEQLLSNNTLLEGVYLDQKVVIQQMMDHDKARLEALIEFCESVEESCSKLKGLLSKSVEFRSKKIGHVVSYLEKTEALHKELVQCIVNPPSVSDQSGWMGKPDIRCDRYLQRKFLQQKERLFLNQVKALGQKIIGLLHSIFIKEEPLICAMLGRETERYFSLNKAVYGTLMYYEHPTKVDISQVNQDLKEALANIIPVEWKMFINIDMSHIEQILNQIHAYMQNHIFLPTVTIEDELVIIQQHAKWVCKTELSPTKHKSKKTTSSHGKQNQLEGANQPTYAALITQRTNKSPTAKGKGMDVLAVLTADKYLHLESGQKIACLKLKRLKLKRKGERSIVLNQNSRSITNIFSPSLYLGELIFASQEMADDFAKAILSTSK